MFRKLVEIAARWTDVLEERIEIVTNELLRVFDYEVEKSKAGEMTPYDFETIRKVYGPNTANRFNFFVDLLSSNGADEKKVYFLLTYFVAHDTGKRMAEDKDLSKTYNSSVAQNYLLRNEIEDTSEIDSIMRIEDAKSMPWA